MLVDECIDAVVMAVPFLSLFHVGSERLLPRLLSHDRIASGDWTFDRNSNRKVFVIMRFRAAFSYLCFVVAICHGRRVALADGPTAAERSTAAWMQGLINQAIESGAKSVTIPPGTYRVAAPTPGHEVLNVLNAHGLTIDATGVNLQVTEPEWGLYVRWSNNVTVKGLSIDYDPLPFTQGRIFGKALDNSSYYVQVDAGYDVVTGSTRAIFYDANGAIKPNTVAESGTITALGGRLVRVDGKAFQGDVNIGDLVSLTRSTTTLHAVEIEGTTGSTFQNLTVQSSPNYGIFETSSGGNTYQHVQVVPGPKPAGATRDRLLSSAADGFHSFNASIGPKIIASNFADGGDDAIAINGMYALVGAASGNKLIVSAANSLGLSFQVGDKVRGYNRATGAVSDATVTAILSTSSLNFAPIVNQFLPQHFSGTFTNGFALTLDKPMTIGTGDVLASPDRSGSGYQVLNTTIENNRARGIIAKGSNGLIQGNTIDGSTVAGIVVAAEPWPWQEGDFSHNVSIVDNTVMNTGSSLTNSWETESGAISVTGSYGWTGQNHGNINISGNVVQNAPGANLVVNLAQGVTINSNEFINPLSRPTTGGSQVGIDPTSVISLDRASNVSFGGNTVLNPGSYGNGLIRSTAHSTNLSGADSGIHVVYAQPYAVVANYRDNFETTVPPRGWNYLWNRDGAIGDPSKYVPLVAAYGAYVANPAAFPAPGVGQYIHLSGDGGHPGLGVGEGAASDKFAIAAYTVQSDGLYAIRDSILRGLDLSSSGVSVFINVNDNAPLLDQDFVAGVTASFDVLLGQLKQGDTIYVGVGPHGSHGFDTFKYDFSIAKFLSSGSSSQLAQVAGAIPEPSTGYLTLIFVGTMANGAAARRWLGSLKKVRICNST
jgi:hypothetical protein